MNAPTKIREVFNLLGAVEEPKEDDGLPDNEYFRKQKEERGTLTALLDGREIAISYGQYGSKGRLNVYGWYPRTSDNRYVSPRDCLNYDERKDYRSADITVAETKTAEQIAKDITRRFLPVYAKYHDMVVAEIAKQNAYRTNKDANRKAIADLLGGSVSPHDDSSVWTTGRIRVKYANETTSNIEIDSVTLEELRQIAAIIRPK